MNIEIYIKTSYNPSLPKMKMDVIIRGLDRDIINSLSINSEGSQIKAEYIALLWAIEKIKKLIKGQSNTIKYFSKNQVVISQLNNKYRTYDQEILSLKTTILKLLNNTKFEATYMEKAQFDSLFNNKTAKIYSEDEIKKLLNEIDSQTDIWT